MNNMIRNSILICSMLLFGAFSLKADVPPETGYERVSINLVTETTEDLSDFRFFLDFYGDLREVEITYNGRTEIPPMGGGARYGSGTFLAIPKKSLKNFEGKLSNEQANNLSRAIKNKEIEGAVELAKHRFSRDVPRGEKPAAVYYVLTRAENTLKAEQIIEENKRSNNNLRSFFEASRLSYVFAGIFITLAVLITGIIAFRKASKKV